MSTPRVRPELFAAVLLFGYMLAPGVAQACSCFGTISIGEALGAADKVVLGEITGRRDIPPERRDGMVQIYPDAAVVKVARVLRGSAPDEILISSDFMCYRSFNVEDFKPGEVYVFPIIHLTDQGVNVLPSCSHSALKLVDGQLYTNERTPDGRHQLQPYMSLSLLQWLVPMRLLDIRGQSIYAAGFILLACLVATNRVRKRAGDPAAIERQPLRWRAIFAIAWMTLWSGICILIAINAWDWLPAALGILFAVAAVGIVLRWSWAEGLAYALVLIWIVACVALTLGARDWFVSYDGAVNEKLYYLLAIEVVCLAGMLLSVDGVRRRFSHLQA